MTHSANWEICAVPRRLPDDRGEVAHMLSHNRLIIIYDVGMCSYHMMKLMKMVSTLRNISNMRCSVSSPDETLIRELKIRRAAEYF